MNAQSSQETQNLCGYCKKGPHDEKDCRTKKRDEKEKKEKEEKAKKEAAELEKKRKEEAALSQATQKNAKARGKGAKDGMPTFPCKLLVHGKPCNYGDRCNFSHDDALVKRFQQAECPHGKGCAFKDVGSGCIYGRHNLPAPTSQDTVREDEEIAHAQDAVRGDDGHADNAWFLDTCCTAGVFKTPQLAPSHPPDSRVF